MSAPADPDRSLTEAKRRAEAGLSEPDRAAMDKRAPPHPGGRIFVRGPWEMVASILIGMGVLMLMQPFFLWAYTWSFIVILTGTVMFLVVSHFPE